jgi:hypothetical protein
VQLYFQQPSVWHWTCNNCGTPHVTVEKCLIVTFLEPKGRLSAETFQRGVCTHTGYIKGLFRDAWLAEGKNSRNWWLSLKPGNHNILFSCTLLTTSWQGPSADKLDPTMYRIPHWFQQTYDKKWCINPTKHGLAIFPLPVSGVSKLSTWTVTFSSKYFSLG